MKVNGCEDDADFPRPVEDVEADLINRMNQKLVEYEQEVNLEGHALSKMLSPQSVDGQCYFLSPR